VLWPMKMSDRSADTLINAEHLPARRKTHQKTHKRPHTNHCRPACLATVRESVHAYTCSQLLQWPVQLTHTSVNKLYPWQAAAAGEALYGSHKP
jgi:hypothetical protein